MAILVKAPELPFLGGIVTWWEKEPGQEVQFGDTLVEIRSGSDDHPIKAYLPGTLLHIFAKAGTEVMPDAPLALIGEKDENIAEWLSMVAAPDQSIPASTAVGSAFSTMPATPNDASGFTTQPTDNQSGFEVSKDTISDGAAPFSSSGSSFTTQETVGSPEFPPLQPAFTPTDHLTTEQAHNTQSYGRGFDKFVKMRPVPQQGAMGELFFATQAISGREVVIKRLKPERRNDAKTREYFMREINLGTVLPYHKNIITILYSDENENGPYYVMERINGHSLQHLIDNQQLPADRLRDIYLGILEGLRHIHAHWMVHRDLKPMNILVDTQMWTPKIIDFGFAKHPSYPDIDVFDMGTAGYMAPEQHGDQKDVTFKADIYAMGCVLYNMLTREHPQTMDTPKITDPLYATLIAKSTQTNPADRYASVQEMIEALSKKGADSGFTTRKEATVPNAATVTPNHSLEDFKAFINEWAVEAVSSPEPLSKMTLKLLQKQAETAGINFQQLEPELSDFVDLYQEIKASGELTAFKKRSLQVQASLVYISEETVDRILQSSNIPVSQRFSIKTTGTFPVYTAIKKTSRPAEQPVSLPEPESILPVISQPEEDIPTQWTYYARAVGLFEAFEVDKLTTSIQADSLFEIQLSDASNARFVIANNQAAQDTALQNKRFYLHPACVLAEVEPVQTQKITTLQAGVLQRNGNFWKIIEKAKIRIG